MRRSIKRRLALLLIKRPTTKKRSDKALRRESSKRPLRLKNTRRYQSPGQAGYCSKEPRQNGKTTFWNCSFAPKVGLGSSVPGLRISHDAVALLALLKAKFRSDIDCNVDRPCLHQLHLSKKKKKLYRKARMSSCLQQQPN